MQCSWVAMGATEAPAQRHALPVLPRVPTRHEASYRLFFKVAPSVTSMSVSRITLTARISIMEGHKCEPSLPFCSWR